MANISISPAGHGPPSMAASIRTIAKQRARTTTSSTDRLTARTCRAGRAQRIERTRPYGRRSTALALGRSCPRAEWPVRVTGSAARGSTRRGQPAAPRDFRRLSRMTPRRVRASYTSPEGSASPGDNLDEAKRPRVHVPQQKTRATRASDRAGAPRRVTDPAWSGGIRPILSGRSGQPHTGSRVARARRDVRMNAGRFGPGRVRATDG